MGRRPEINWEPIKMMFVAGKTARELNLIFGVSADVILNKSKADGWGALRKQVKSLPLPNSFSAEPKIPKPRGRVAKTPKEIGFKSELAISESNSESEMKTNNSDAIVQHALRLRNSDSFRERVVAQADKALTTLEKSVVSNVFETDRFAEALTKVERIGARAYGYDREGDHPIVNIGILGSGSEYDPI
jgi:hypothetical protein